jgi:hypothetical protein
MLILSPGFCLISPLFQEAVEFPANAGFSQKQKDKTKLGFFLSSMRKNEHDA